MDVTHCSFRRAKPNSTGKEWSLSRAESNRYTRGNGSRFCAAAVFYGASTSYANAQMPPWLQRPTPQVIVCASLAGCQRGRHPGHY